MKSPKKILLMSIFFFCAFVFACVTINIYFPAEKVESVAEEIVSDIRSKEPADQKSPKEQKDSLLRQRLFAWVGSCARAEEALTVSNPTIRGLKESMKDRYPLLRPFYQKGNLEEGKDGFLTLKNTQGLGLKERRDLQGLVDAENGDRERLYKEITKALKIDPGQEGRVAEIFAKEWQKPVR